MASTTRGGRARGRIHLHQRNTDDNTPLMGGDVEILEEHRNAMNATKKKETEVQTKNGHRNRLKAYIEWLRVNYPTYYTNGTRALSDEERKDEMLHYHKCTRDLIYEGLNVEFVLAYMAANKIKPSNNKMYSFSHMRKMHDAILFGSKMVKQRMPSSYYSEMESFLASFKKEVARAKSAGNLDENTSDPICYSLYKNICKWALENSNIFLWTWTILQWNLMARSISVDPLALHNMQLGVDCIVFQHDSTKADQEGEKTYKKHVYGNPLSPSVCVLTAMGIWFALEQDSIAESERFFLRGNAKKGSASGRYCEQLVKLLDGKRELVDSFVVKTGAHGTRKGAAVHVTSGTTCPPPVSSVALRGDWSMGKVLDVYWKFGEPGDSYLGRCLSGLNPNNASFAILPPHFCTLEEDNSDVKEGMDLMYGKITSKWSGLDNDPTGILRLCLGSVVYHSDWIIGIGSRIPGHPFMAIPVLQNGELLNKLKQQVTTDESDNMAPTGIPPHVSQSVELHRLLELSTTILEKVSEQNEVIRTSIFDAIERHAINHGSITRTHLTEILNLFKAELKEDVRAQLQELHQNGFGGNATTTTADQHRTGNNPSSKTKYEMYWYKERAWHVPEGFIFPDDTKRNVGFKLWLLGMPNYHRRNKKGVLVHAPVRPFRLLKPSFLPAPVAKKFKLHWRPLYLMMQEGFELDSNNELTTEVVNEYYKAGDKYLRENRVSYIYATRKYNPENWRISTWSKYIGRNHIEKHGTESDLQNLPEANRYNRPHQGRKRKVQLKENNRTRRRQTTTQGGRQRRHTNQLHENVAGDAFATAFSNIPVPAAAVERDEQRRAETAEEDARDVQQALENSRQPRNPNFVAISTDGLGRNSADPHYRQWLDENVTD